MSFYKNNEINCTLSLRTSLLPEGKFLLYQRTAERRINLNPVRVQKNNLQYVISVSQLLEAISYRLFFYIFNYIFILLQMFLCSLKYKINFIWKSKIPLSLTYKFIIIIVNGICYYQLGKTFCEAGDEKWNGNLTQQR